LPDDPTSHRTSSSTERYEDSEPLPAERPEPTEEAGENKLKDILWEDGDDDDDDDDGDEEDENPVLKSAREAASSTVMDVEEDDGVDIGVPQLRDYLSDRPAMSPLVDVREGLNVTKRVASLSAPKVFEVRDMTF
jgi:hypothetical protein